MKISCCWMYAIGKYGFPPHIDHMYSAIHEMADLGFSYIELEGVAVENLEAVIARRAGIRDALKDAGVQLSNFAVLAPDIISLDADKAGRAFEIFERGVETAAFLESPFVWIDSYYPPLEVVEGALMTNEITFGQRYRMRVPDDFSWPRFWDNFVSVFRRCNEIAKKNGLQLLVEPRVGEVTPNVDSLLRLIDAVNDRNFGVIFDTAHQHAQKEVLPLSVAKLGDSLRYVHVADNDSTSNWHRVPGSGTIDWDEVFRQLKRLNFAGYYAIDLEKMPNLAEEFVASKLWLERYAAKYNL
jgi:sugar phosphate isomerase/epimerase